MVDEDKAYIVDPGGEFNASIRDAVKKVGDLTIPFKLMTREWFKSNRSIFDKGRKGPGKYPVLGGINPEAVDRYGVSNQEKAHRAKERETAKYGRPFIYPILVRSGKLKRSMTEPDNPDAVNLIINKSSLILGTSVTDKRNYPYPIALQAGASGMYHPRPFVLLGPEQVAEAPINKRQENWMNILSDYVAKVLEKRSL